STFPVEVSLTAVALDREYLLAVVRDVTERHRADEAVRRSAARFARAEAVAQVAGWTYDVRAGAYVTSDEGRRIYELGPGPYTPEDLARKVPLCHRARLEA